MMYPVDDASVDDASADDVPVEDVPVGMYCQMMSFWLAVMDECCS